MTDFLQTTRDEISVRLKKLEPLVAEYRQLETAAAALDGLSADVASASTGTRARARATTRPVSASRAASGRRRGRPRGSGTRALQAIELIKSQPGMTVGEIASAMGIKQNYLYRVLPALEKDKKVVKRGKGWHAAES